MLQSFRLKDGKQWTLGVNPSIIFFTLSNGHWPWYTRVCINKQEDIDSFLVMFLIKELNTSSVQEITNFTNKKRGISPIHSHGKTGETIGK